MSTQQTVQTKIDEIDEQIKEAMAEEDGCIVLIQPISGGVPYAYQVLHNPYSKGYAFHVIDMNPESPKDTRTVTTSPMGAIYAWAYASKHLDLSKLFAFATLKPSDPNIGQFMSRSKEFAWDAFRAPFETEVKRVSTDPSIASRRNALLSSRKAEKLAKIIERNFSSQKCTGVRLPFHNGPELMFAVTEKVFDGFYRLLMCNSGKVIGTNNVYGSILVWAENLYNDGKPLDKAELKTESFTFNDKGVAV